MAAQVNLHRPTVSEKVDLELEPQIEGQPLHEGQRKAWNSARRFVAVFAGWRSGKTEIGPWLLLREIQRKGAGDYAVIAPTFPLLDNKARPVLRKALVKALGANGYHSSGDIWTITPEGQRRLWGEVFETETRILFRHGTRADAIEAFDGKGVWLDEPGQMDDEIWEAVQARVSIGLYRLFLTSRPYYWNFYVTDIWERVCDDRGGRRPDADPNIECVNFRSLDNPAFSQEEWDRQKGRLPDWKFALKFEGLPTRPAGAIYDCFSTKNVKDGGNIVELQGAEIPKEWPRYGGIDFGPDNTAACKVAGEREMLPNGKWGEMTGRFLLYSEYHDGGKTPEEHIEGVMTSEPKMFAFWGGSAQEEDSRRLYTKCGMPVHKPMVSDVEAGIDVVYALLKQRKLLVSSECTKTIRQFVSYSRELDESDEPIEKSIKDKAKFHNLDSVRYVAPALQVVPMVRRPTPAKDFAWSMPE